MDVDALQGLLDGGAIPLAPDGHPVPAAAPAAGKPDEAPDSTPATANRSGHIVAGGGALRIIRPAGQARLVLSGDIDEATYAALVAELSAVTDVPGDVHVDLGAVEFCDVAGLRALVLLTAARGSGQDHQGRRVIFRPLPAHLKTLLQILGWDCTPGLFID